MHFRFLIGGLLLLFCTTTAVAQITPPNRSGGDLLSQFSGLQAGNQPGLDLADLSKNLLVLEGAIDPQTYIVGPGDQFAVSIGGSIPIQAIQPVSADGVLILPTVGQVQAAGRLLADVQADAQTLLKRNFERVDTAIALAVPRQFFVHVTGAVPWPERFLVEPIGRVSSVLEQAYAAKVVEADIFARLGQTGQAITADQLAFMAASERPQLNETYQPNFRAIEIRHRDSTHTTIDLLRYYATGNTTQNPYLLDGDVVYVPAYNPEKEAVYVDGEVAFPEMFPFKSGDTILDVLTIAAGGPAGLEHLDAVRLSRLSSDGMMTATTHAIADLLRNPTAAPRLQPRDHLHIPERQLAGGTVTLEGLVYYPGTYPIEQGQTTLKTVLEAAGHFRPEALVRGAYIMREPEADASEIVLPARNQGFPSSTNNPDFLLESRLSDLDFLSRTYMARELELQKRISLDFETAFSDAAPPIYLRAGDRIVVPRDEKSVLVIGEVLQPGKVNYTEGQDVDAYVAAAGGLGPQATDIYVRDIETRRWVLAENTTIESGDMLFVNRLGNAETESMRRLELQEEQFEFLLQNNRRDTRFRYITTILSVIGTATTVILAINAIKQ